MMAIADSTPAHLPVSVLILAMNEESNIRRCLECVSFSDDIVVLDSGSTDQTKEIVRSFPGTRIFERPFDTEWKQRNHGLHAVDYKYPWVYICDADERVTPELAREIGAIAANRADPHVAYRLRFRNYFMGRWIKHASGYPVWVIRFVRPEKVRYEMRETNVHPICDGAVGQLKEHFEHYSFNLGLRRWFEKHNYYSSREAAEGVKLRAEGLPSVAKLMTTDPMARRRALKNLSYFLVCRGLWRFVTMYLVRGGILDGVAGFQYSAMIAMYEYWIELKMLEGERHWNAHLDELVGSMLKDQA